MHLAYIGFMFGTTMLTFKIRPFDRFLEYSNLNNLCFSLVRIDLNAEIEMFIPKINFNLGFCLFSDANVPNKGNKKILL